MQVNLNITNKQRCFGSLSKASLKSKFAQKIKRFPKDWGYLKQLAESCKMPSEDVYKLYSIIGPEELTGLLKNAPRKFFDPNEDFRMNLHIHTTSSDGKMSVSDLLEQSVQYADNKSQIDESPNFSIAITDHDNLDGAKEAISLLISNPQKYQNLGVVLGAELSSLYRDKEAFTRPFAFEMVGYSLNPYDENLNTFLNTVRKERISLAKEIISRAEQKYPQYNFSYDEACELSNNPKKGIDGFLYSLANYFKDKAVLENDKKILEKLALEYLPDIEGQKFNITNSIEDLFNLFRNKFGFLGIAHPAKIFLGDGLLKKEFIQKCKAEHKNAGREVINKFVDFLSKVGEDKFSAIETNYQAYKGDLRIAQDILMGKKELTNKDKETVKWLENFRNLAEKYNLLESGGLDTHGDTPFIIH